MPTVAGSETRSRARDGPIQLHHAQSEPRVFAPHLKLARRAARYAVPTVAIYRLKRYTRTVSNPARIETDVDHADALSRSLSCSWRD